MIKSVIKYGALAVGAVLFIPFEMMVLLVLLFWFLGEKYLGWKTNLFT